MITTTTNNNRITRFAKQLMLALVLTIMSFSSHAGSGIFESYAVFNSTFYDLQNPTGNPDFQGAALGNFASGASFTFGGQIKTFKNGADNICGGKIFYSIYAASGSPGSFTSVALPFDANLGGGDQRWTTSPGGSIAFPTTPGAYKIAAYVTASGDGSGGCASDPFHTSNNGGAYWIANFNVCGTGVGALPAGNYAIPGCFATVSAAVTYINTNGVSGAVQFNVASGHTETAPAGGINITATGTVTNTITFKESGVGTNPLITAGAQVAGGNFDGVIRIVGGDYITFDAIDVRENTVSNTVTATGATNTMTEFGYVLVHGSATDGCQNNTIQNCTITMSTVYTNAVGIFSTSSSTSAFASPPGNSSTDATSSAGTNSNNKIYGNVIASVTHGILFICPPITATVNESGNDIGGSSSATGNTITFGNTSGGSGPWNRSSSSTCAGVQFRNGAGNSVRFNAITSNNLAYTMSAFGGILISSGTAPSGVTYTSTISNNTVTLNNTGTVAMTAIDFGHGISTGTIAGSNNTITINQNVSAAVSAALTGIKANYTAATNTVSTNSITTNQNTSSGALTSPITLINVGGAATTLNVTSNNPLSVKQNAPTGSGSYGSGAINYVDIGSVAHGTANVTGNTFNTTGSTIRSTGAMNCVSQGSTTITTLVNVKSNTATIDRVAAAGAVGFFTQTSTAPNDPGDTLSSNNITFTNLAGTTSVIAIQKLGGSGSAARSIYNNTISITGTNTGAVTGISYAYSTLTITKTNSITVSTASTSITGITATSNNTASSVGGNTINLTSSTTSPTAMVGISLAGAGAHSVTANTFTAMNFTGIVTGSPVVTAISLASGNGSANVFSNVITNISVGAATSTASPVINGVLISGGTGVNVYKNRIFGLTTLCTGTSTLISGITISGGGGTNPNNIYNNLIGVLTASAAASTDAIRGINITSTTTSTSHNVYFNTIYLNASSSGTNFGTTGIFHTVATVSTTSALNMRNNIIVNNSTASGTGLTVVFRRSLGTLSTHLSNYASTSNNNFFFTTAGASNFYYNDGTSSALTMAAYKAGVFTAGTIAPRDASSVSETVSNSAGVFFQSFTGSNATTFLHMVNGLSTQVESGGATIATYTDDYDADTRNVTTPDIGADEFTGVAADLTAPSISYTVIPNNSCTGNVTLSATITDASSVNTTGGTKPRLYYKKSGDANTYVGNTNSDNGWKYVEATNASSPFSFTTDYTLLQSAVVAADVIQYFVVAQDLAGTPNVGINSGTFAASPTSVALTSAAFALTGTINSYTVLAAGLTGTVTIGAAGTYTSITGASGLFSAINTSGLSGNVTANIVDLSVTETGATVLNTIAYGCATYTLTIKPNAANTVLTGSVAGGAILKLNGTDNVVIDGSTSGGTDRSLTITNTNTSTTSAVVWIASASASDGATSNTVKNCIITGNATTTTLMGIFSGGTASISTTGNALVSNSSNTYQNNLVSKSQYGIYCIGTSTSALDQTLTISDNTIGVTGAGNGTQIRGIVASLQQSATISGNDILNVSSSTTFTNLAGINLQDSKSCTLSKNKIHNMSYTGSSTTKVYGIYSTGTTFVTSGNPSNNVHSNNTVYDLISSGTSSSWNTSGINCEGAYGDKYYFNSVSLTGSLSGSGGTAGSAAFSIGNGITSAISTSGGFDIRDNIFSNTGTSVAAAPMYAHFTTLTNYTGSTLNFNDLYVAAVAPATTAFARINATNYANLAAWLTPSGEGANTISSDPLFNSSTNLQPSTGSPVLAAGVTISGITTDIVGVTRGGSPSIGAYETGLDALAPAISYTALTTSCSTTDRTLASVTITDGSGVNTTAGTKPRLYFKKSTDANTYVGNTNADNGWKYTEATNGASPFSFTTDFTLLQSAVVAGNTIQYFVVAQDLAATPNVGINSGVFAATPTSVALTSGAFAITGTINSYTINNNLAGAYNVGSAETPPFNTITGAVGAYNTGCLSAAVIFNLTDATYSGSETFPITIGTNSFANATNTLTIKPAAAATVTVSGANATALFDINNGDYIIIDGSNAGTSSKDLTISNTSTSGAVVRLINDATNNVIKNSILNGVSTSTSNGVVFISTTSGTTGNDNNTIQDNTIARGATSPAYGYFNSGTTTTTTLKNSGLVVSGNKIFDFSVNGIRDDGGSVGTTYSGNEIYEVTAQTTSLVGFRPSSTTIEGFTFTKNNIHDLATSSTGTVFGIHLFDIQGATTGELSNNFINLSPTAPLTLRGIYDQSATGELFNLFYNTVNISGAVSGASSSEAYYWSIASTTVAKNNLFVNSRTGGSSKHYAIRFNGTFANITSDYNDIYNSGGTGNVFGNDATADRAAIAAWRTATGKDAASISVQPYFTSSTDLHLLTASNCGIDGKGQVVSVTVDYDAATRDASTPDIGADEFTSTFAVNAGSDQSLLCNATTLAGSAVPSGGTGLWTVFSGSATITTSGSATSTLTAIGVGANTLRWTVSAGSCGPTSDDVIITATDDSYWIGGTSSVWTNPANWCGGVPTASSDVIVPNGATFYPDITTGSQVAQSITIANAATLTISGGSLTMATGDIANDGALTVGSSGTLNLGGNQITGTGTVTINGLFETSKAVGFSGDPNTAIANTITSLTLGSASTIDYTASGGQTITAANYANLSNSGNAGRTLSGTIRISGTFSTGSGNYTIGTSTIEFNGTVAQTVPAPNVSSGANYNNLIINNSDGAALGGNVNLKDALTLTSGAFTTTGFTFTLLSTATSTARIAPITGGSIVGDVTMERFVPAGATNWSTIGMPVGGATLVQWNDDFATSGYTGSTYGAGIFNSVYTYDESATGYADDPASYVPATNSSNSVDPKLGYYVYLDVSGFTMGSKTIDVTGPPLTGFQNMNVTFNPDFDSDEDGWNLISNPYCSAIDWTSGSWTKTNVDDAIYIYDRLADQYAYYIDGLGGFNGGSEIIASSQAFLVHANALAPSLTADEGVKVATNASFFKTSASVASGILRMQLDGLNGTYYDETVFRTRAGATNNFDPKYDAYKLYSFNAAAPNISSKMGGVEYVVNSVDELTGNFDLPVRVNVNTAGNYTINFKGLANFADVGCLTFEDKLTNTWVDLKMDSTYTFTSQIDTASASPRFVLHFGVENIVPQIMPSATTVSFPGSTNVDFANLTTGATSYSWDFGDGSPLETVVSPSHVFDSVGTYVVTMIATNAAGCSVTSTVTINVDNVTGLSNLTAEETVSIGQDAQGAFVNYNFKSNTKLTINIYNALGAVVESGINKTVLNKGRLSLNNLNVAKGVYSIEVLFDNKKIVRKMTF